MLSLPTGDRRATVTTAELPDQGVVFWPVGTGDSTTIVVDDRHVIQVDLRDMAAANEGGAVVAAVIDRLAETLPRTSDGSAPYLSVFALTHGDLDHCAGFGRLLDSEIVIGEIWATPRLWREHATDQEMCADAKRFHDEADRRVKATLEHIAGGRVVPSGDRVRVIGYDEDFEELDLAYSALPDDCVSFPGDVIETLDGDDAAGHFSGFVHAPFKDDCAGPRNETSLAIHITLRNPGHQGGGGILLFGDLSYETIKKIFARTQARPERLAWDVMLAAHHCSKSVMYAAGEDGDIERKDDLLQMFVDAAGSTGYVVASSRPFRDVDSTGDNPPHLLARDAYDEIAPSGVLCTGEYPSTDAPRPIVFGLFETGLELVEVDDVEEASSESAASRLLKALGLTAAVGMAVAGTVAARRAGSRPGFESSLKAVETARGSAPESLPAVGFGRRLGNAAEC